MVNIRLGGKFAIRYLIFQTAATYTNAIIYRSVHNKRKLRKTKTGTTLIF